MATLLMQFNDSKDFSDLIAASPGVTIPGNTPAWNTPTGGFLEQLFSTPPSVPGGYFCTAVMSRGFLSGQRSAYPAAGTGEFPIGIDLVERRGDYGISEDAGGGNLLEEALVKPYKLHGDAGGSGRTNPQVWEKWSKGNTELKVSNPIGRQYSKTLCVMPVSLANVIIYSLDRSPESSPTLKSPEPEASL